MFLVPSSAASKTCHYGSTCASTPGRSARRRVHRGSSSAAPSSPWCWTGGAPTWPHGRSTPGSSHTSSSRLWPQRRSTTEGSDSSGPSSAAPLFLSPAVAEGPPTMLRALQGRSARRRGHREGRQPPRRRLGVGQAGRRRGLTGVPAGNPRSSSSRLWHRRRSSTGSPGSSGLSSAVPLSWAAGPSAQAVAEGPPTILGALWGRSALLYDRPLLAA